MESKLSSIRTEANRLRNEHSNMTIVGDKLEDLEDGDMSETYKV